MIKQTKKQIEARLNPLGWTLKSKYKGMVAIHTVQCTSCGCKSEKRLHNLIYKEQKCSMCSNTDIELILEKIEKLQQAMGQLPTVNNFVEAIEKFLTVTKGKRKETKRTELKRVFQKYISKIGFSQKNRKLLSDEWFELSHQLAEELMTEIAKDRAEFEKWERLYIEILQEHPKKQGQDILPIVIPRDRHLKMVEKITIKFVKA